MTDAAESEAIDALQRLGLSQYEAAVFVALEKLGTGTASDVDGITDVPRSQVYGAAENLEDRGLVEVQQSNPIQYRAVDLDEAKALLRERFIEEQNCAFDYLRDAREAFGGDDAEKQEGVWTVNGHENVTARIRQLVADADDRITFGTPEDLLENSVVEAIRDRSDSVDALVMSSEAAVTDRFADVDGVTVSRIPEEFDKMDAGRFLAVDEDTILLSVLGADAGPRGREETAIWSSETAIASVLLQLARSQFDAEIDRPL
jgi:sugar-specific transcriptional regulator TrmB